MRSEVYDNGTGKGTSTILWCKNRVLLFPRLYLLELVPESQDVDLV